MTKKNKKSHDGDSSQSQTATNLTSEKVPSKLPKSQEPRTSPPSTSALIICRNKYVLAFLHNSHESLGCCFGLGVIGRTLPVCALNGSVPCPSSSTRPRLSTAKPQINTNCIVGIGAISLPFMVRGYNYLQKYWKVWQITTTTSRGHGLSTQQCFLTS